MQLDDSKGPHYLDAFPGRLTDAVLGTVAYADVFDFPLTREEVERFCMAPAGQPHEINVAINRLIATGSLETKQQYVFLSGRRDTVTTRRHRARCSGRTWATAHGWGRVIWAMPFVRMVAVTGSLAANSMEVYQDIDYLIVVQPGRLWLVRAACFVLSFLAFLAGSRICPNYMLTTNKLVLTERNLYTARELVQMVPLHGTEVVTCLWNENRWALGFLPNATLDCSRISDAQSLWVRALKRVAEYTLNGPMVDRLEKRACSFQSSTLARIADRRHNAGSRRDMKKSAVDEAGPHESVFSSDVCKFHTCEHNNRVLALYAERLAYLVNVGDQRTEQELEAAG